MHWIDWCIMIIPVIVILGLAIYSGKYVRGVVDFLAAGRVAGRYVISVGDLTAGLSVITLVALCEAKYQTGYGVDFWGKLVAPLGVIFSLTGYCVYRWRETKALSFGQFLEICGKILKASALYNPVFPAAQSAAGRVGAQDVFLCVTDYDPLGQSLQKAVQLGVQFPVGLKLVHNVVQGGYFLHGTDNTSDSALVHNGQMACHDRCCRQMHDLAQKGLA